MSDALAAYDQERGLESRFLLPAILVAAMAVRVLFFSGYFGSDEVTYTEQAIRLLHGEWPQSDYIGAVRLGITFPVAILMWLFGNTEFAANLWSLLCSLGEIALVFLLAKEFWGTRAAALSSLLLAFTPLHAHYAGRLMADAPLAFFITLSFFALFWGDRHGNRLWYIAAGLAAGMVWWVKSHVAIVYLLVFALYVLRERRLRSKWFLMAAGFLVMALLNGLIFQLMEGDFWKIYRMTTSGTTEYVQDQIAKTSPAYFLRYLFIELQHTLLLGPLAASGALLWIWRRRADEDNGLALTVIWGLGMVAIFSLFVVSLNPLLFITKQVNYMIVFLAPLALLAGYALSRLSNSLSIVAASALVMFGVLGAALEQLDVQSFVANSKAALAFAGEHPKDRVFGMTNASRLSTYARLFAATPETVPQILAIDQLREEGTATPQEADPQTPVSYAIFDRQTRTWGANGLYSQEKNLPACWRHQAELRPQGTGLGRVVVEQLASAASWLPGSIGQTIHSRLERMLTPLPASVYRLPRECSPRSSSSPEVPGADLHS